MAIVLDPTTIMRLNERRQQAVIAEISDEHERVPAAEGGGTVAYKQGVDWLCQAIGCGLEAPITADGIDRVGRFLRARGARPSIDLTDQSGEEAFAVVSRAGMTLDHAERVYAIDLRRAIEPPAVPGLRIEPLNLNDHEAVRALVRHRVEGFAQPDDEPTPGDAEAAERSQRHPRSRGFCAFVDGELAGTCGMEVIELEPGPGQAPVRLASLWAAVVGEPFRQRGIQAALIARRLRQGLEEGCSVGVIECEPGIATERNAIRLGFSLAYTRLGFKGPAPAGTVPPDGQ